MADLSEVVAARIEPVTETAAKPSKATVAQRTWSTNLPPGLDELAEQACKANGMTRAEYIRQLISRSVAGAETEPVRTRAANRKPIKPGDLTSLAAVVAEFPNGISRRELFKILQATPRSVLRIMLATLVNRKAIIAESVDRGGRPATVYRAADLPP